MQVLKEIAGIYGQYVNVKVSEGKGLKWQC